MYQGRARPRAPDVIHFARLVTCRKSSTTLYPNSSLFLEVEELNKLDRHKMLVCANTERQTWLETWFVPPIRLGNAVRATRCSFPATAAVHASQLIEVLELVRDHQALVDIA